MLKEIISDNPKLVKFYLHFNNHDYIVKEGFIEIKELFFHNHHSLSEVFMINLDCLDTTFYTEYDFTRLVNFIYEVFLHINNDSKNHIVFLYQEGLIDDKWGTIGLFRPYKEAMGIVYNGKYKKYIKHNNELMFKLKINDYNCFQLNGTVEGYIP